MFRPLYPTAAHPHTDGAPSRTDRKSADAIFLSTSPLTPELSRVNSTPLSSEALDALTIQPCSSATTHDPLRDPSPLTMAPPKPAPADTLYPSPSGGFVPSPEEGQDWRLKPPPPGRTNHPPSASSSSNLSVATAAAASASSSSSASDAISPVSEARQRPASGLSPATPTRPPSLPSSHETAAKIANAASGSLSRRSSQASNALTSPSLGPTSSSSSSRHRLSTASSVGSGLVASRSQAAAITTDHANSDAAQSSCRHSAALQNADDASQPSANVTRPSSTASYQTARHADTDQDAPFAIKVRDFAYAPQDPRHHGQQLADAHQSAESQQADQLQDHQADAAEHEFYIEGADDEMEFDGDEGDNAQVPEGVYKVLYEFEPVSEHELAVQPGDVVHVVGSLQGGWAIALKEGDEAVKGLVPATYLESSGPLPEAD